MFFIELRGLFQRLPQRGWRLGAVGFAGFRHRQADVLRQRRHRVGKAHVLIFHQEAERGAVRAAAEAVIELLGRADREGGGFFAVEGAAGLVILPGFFQRHAPVDDVDDVDAGEQGVDEIARDHGCCMINPGGPGWDSACEAGLDQRGNLAHVGTACEAGLQ